MRALKEAAFRFIGRLSRRYWISLIDRVLLGAYQAGVIDSWLLHELDYRMKYKSIPWMRRPVGEEVER